MVRQRTRKSLEELYGTKLDGTKPHQQASSMLKHPRTVRGERSNDYSNHHCATMPSTAHAMPAGMATARRKTTTRAHNATSKAEKNCSAKDDMKHIIAPICDDVKKEHVAKTKTARVEKMHFNCATTYDNKAYVDFVDNQKHIVHTHLMNGHQELQQQQQQNCYHNHHQHQQQQRQQPQQQQMHNPSEADDKDDETEEFFQLIRQTVENAIGKSVNEILNRNFRELGNKIDRFSNELKTTNVFLNKLQNEVCNKVVHYGEENSRHFRYLCMKSEYDKMFYQHHSMLATTTAAQTPIEKAHKITAPPTVTTTHMENEKKANGCSCHNGNAAAAAVVAATNNSNNVCASSMGSIVGGTGKIHPPHEPHKSSSDDHSISIKSSEIGMREMLEQIQKFCTQMQMNDIKTDDIDPSLTKPKFSMDDPLNINKQVFEDDDDDDDDDFQLSSDGMTPRSDELQKYNCNTSRLSVARTNNGGGDA